MTNTPRLGLPAIEAAQAQKHVTHNEALVLLDALTQLAVESRLLTTPPGSPLEGACTFRRRARQEHGADGAGRLPYSPAAAGCE
jgi:hypothetical protein